MTEENLLGGSDLTGLTPDTIANFKTKPDVLTSGFKASDPFAGQDVYDNLTNQRYNSAPLQDIYPKIPPGVSVDAWAKSANAGIKQKLDQVDSWGADPYKAIKPFTFGTGAQHTNFARYYNHPKFNQLGFTPFRDNETFYNDNSSIVDDLIRAGGQWDNLFASTIKSGYRALGDALTGNFFTPDAQGGRELENAMNIGYSSRGGIMGGFNNLFLQSAIPVGIMVDFAVSEFALGLTGNIPGMGLKVAQTGLNVERAAEILNNTSKLRQFYDGAKKAGVATTEFFLPSTVKNLAEYGPGTGKLANFANVVGTFGDFYRDARNINYALSESKIEGGIVKNKFAQDHIAEIISNEGRNPTDEEMAKIYDYANDAGYSTTVINAPIIFASNKLIFDNLFTTPKFAARSALEAVEFGSKQGTRLVYDATKIAEGKAFRELTGAKDVLATGLKQLARPSTYVTGGINYFKANITEGLQEVTQEIISGSTEDYYNRLYTDAAKGGIDYMLGDTYSNLKKQMSAEGAEVFASGFFMGGLVSMGGRVVNTALRGGRSALNQYYKARNPEAYEKDYEADKARTKEVIDSLNELYSDPMQFFAPDRTTLVELQRLNKTLNNIRENGTDKEFIDVSDISKFVGIYNSLRLNRFDGFKDMLISYRDLSDTELKEALKLEDDVTGQEARDLLEAAIKRADKVQSNYKTFSKYENPFNPERFRKKDINTNEDIKQQYQQEALAYIGFENAKRKATFSMYGFERAKERMASITNNWSANPPVAGAAYSDFSFMFSPLTLNQEVQLLEAEILSLEGSTDAYNIQQLENKKKKLDKLTALQNKFKEQGPQLQTFEFWASPDVRKTFLDYAKTVADINDTYYQEDQALSGINQLADFYLLKGDANKYAEDVNTLMIPQNFYQLAAREAAAMKKINEKKAEYIKDSITNYENVKDTNKLLNLLFDAHIVIDKNDLAVLMSMSPEEMVSSLETYNDIVFINVLTNEIFTKKNTEQYKKVQEVIAEYKASTPEGAEQVAEAEVTEEVTTEDAAAPEAQPEVTTPSTQVPTIKNNAEMTRLPESLKNQLRGTLASVDSKRGADGLDPLSLDNFLSTKTAKDIIKNFFTNPENADVVKQYWDKVTKPVVKAPVTEQPIAETPVIEEQVTTGIRSELVGKVVYASPASGKTTAVGMSENLVDGDDLLLAELKNIPGSEESSAETLARDLAFLADENKDAFETVYSQALKKARALANEGKTVLFGSNRLINDVDVVITSESNEENNQRMVNKFVAAGQSKAGAESSVTKIRKVEKAVKDKTVISIPFDQYVFAETVAEAPVSKSYQSKYDNLVAKLQDVKTLLELNEVQQEFLRQDLIEDADKALQFDALYKQKQKELTETVNFDNVKVGDILFLGDNKYAAVVKTTNNQLTYKPLYGESLQPGKKEDQTKTIRKQDFNKAVVMMYDNQSKAVIGTKKVTKPTKAEESLIKENVQSYQSFTDDAAAITQAETEAREQSSEDIDNDFINGLGC